MPHAKTLVLPRSPRAEKTPNGGSAILRLFKDFKQHEVAVGQARAWRIVGRPGRLSVGHGARSRLLLGTIVHVQTEKQR